MEESVIKVEHVGKIFKLPHEKSTSIKASVVNFYRRDRSFELQKALEDINFEVKKGEFFGIIGSNGSGKSTLLKLLAGIYSPTQGVIHVAGKLTPFIELGVGFNAELTGRENVYLNGALLGFSRKEMLTMYKDIVDFAELERFMDQKLKNYSSGMQVRLAFSIAIRAQSDILLIDEVLAVGDASFQKKCFEYFYDLKKNKKTVVFVSHDMDAIQRFCDQGIWIKNGSIKAIGDSQLVVDKYKQDTFKEESGKNQTTKAHSNIVSNVSINIHDKPIFRHTDTLKLSFNYELIKKGNVELRLAILRDALAFAHASTKGIKLSNKPGEYTSKLEISLAYLMDGQYNIYCGVFEANTGEELAFKSNAASFYITDTDSALYGIVRLDAQWIELPLRQIS